ncbi:MAG: dockerin type I repeat-containing protein [Clostridia bacterium]|nr:dockerin type I repeat-containing protein [Clostridia bacterium]
MKAMKKILAVVLCLLMVLSMGIFATSAADTDNQVIYFEVPAGEGMLNWDGAKIYCHIWAYGGDSFAQWQSKKEACTKTDTEGVWMYDITAKGFEMEEGVTYAVIFSEGNNQTYDTLFDTTCLGDTLYCKGPESIIEAPTDSSKQALAAYWKNADPAKYGPVRQLTSLGNVVGECFAPGADAESLYTDFLVNKLETTLQYVNMTEAELMDHASSQLGLSDERAYELELEAGFHTPMTNDELPLPSDPATDDEDPKGDATGDEFEIGDVNADGKLNIKDATTIQKYAAKMIELDEKAQVRADYNADGKINVKDATQIQKKIANLI